MLALLLPALLATPQLPLDLSHDRTRQVVVDREEGQYLGHVSTTLLADGKTILAFYPKGHGKGPIVHKRSTDGGRTWSERLPLPASFATSLEVPTVHRLVDAGGKERLVLWSGLFPARFATSEDQGSTWTELAAAGEWGGIVVMGDVVATTTKGRYLAFFHDDGRFLRTNGKTSASFTLLQSETRDGGLTWSEPRTIWTGSDVHLCEPGCIRSPDGKELALVLRENRRRANSHVMFSRDEGASWSAPQALHAALTGDRHTLRYAADGRLVAVMRDMRIDGDDATRGDFVAWVGTYEDLKKAGPGQFRVRLLDNQDDWDCGYPGLERLPDGTFVATTYGHWEAGKKPFVVSTRFTLAELEQRAAQGPSTTVDDDATALETLLAYAPTNGVPEGELVRNAEKRLLQSMADVVQKGGATAKRLAELHAARAKDLVPTTQKPIRSRDPLARVLVRFDDERAATADPHAITAHPAAEHFPGRVAEGAVPEPAGLTLDLRTPGRRSLGLYAPPGAAITVVLGDGKQTPKKGMRLRIGAHSDDIRRRDDWPRMPRITRTFSVDRAQMHIACAFGGLLYLELEEGLEGQLDVQVDGCVRAPLFVLGETDPQVWREVVRAYPAPWAEFATDKVVLTVPSERVRRIDDPTAVLTFWNTLLDNAADLGARSRERKRPERYVADVEISNGYMHAGHPIMTHLDAALDMVEEQRLRRGPWGLLHELGHNHQRKDWTFAGTGEVTCNLFSLYLCETQCGVSHDKAWGGNLARAKLCLPELLAAGKKPWQEGPDGKPDLALRLLMYAQLQQAFGWELFTHVFAEYRDLSDDERPKTDAEKRDQWLVRASRSVDRDLGPFFEAWGLPVSEQARAQVAALEDWMPSDWPANGKR